MNNVKLTVKGNILLIEIDVSKRGGISASGKSVQIASTGGNIAVPGFPDVKLGLNVYTKVGG
jgi:hypothetical protein